MESPYTKVTEQYTIGEILKLMNPVIREWFSTRFTSLTEPQSFAIVPIHEGRNVIVSSPTGSGKTMTAFLSIINELMNLEEEGRLEDRIYAVYVSPLRALANDIDKNLRLPLHEISELQKSKGLKPTNIRVAVRSGDTSSYERQKMVRKPPHIFITTPESLALTISSPVFRTKFSGVRWLILDELHEICDSKRGEFLSLTVERLAEYSGDHFSRIGLSATMAPIEEMAAFLGGYDSSGKPRPVSIVEVTGSKEIDLAVICPVRDLNAVPADIANAKMYDELVKLVESHRTTLIFTNTRSATESVAYKLKERGLLGVEAHHGSLSKTTRKDVEDQLKNGELKCVISSTSLELGIDIGYIDLVCQIGSPKSVAKGLQRIGRSGHSVGKTSKGRLLVFDRDDLVECAVLTRSALQNRIDRVDIPKNSLDVLAQSIVGMSLEKKWKVDEAFSVIRRSYCYHELKKEDFISVLNYLGSKGSFENVYSKIWYDENEGTFGKKRSARMIYFLNIGTIAEETSYDVVTERGMHIGQLSDKFVERLSSGDIFVLGGKTYEFVRAKGMTIVVRDAKGKRPTVPSWTGEMLPRSFDLSEDVGRFREMMEEMLEKPEKEVIELLVSQYNVDRWAAKSILNYMKEQKSIAGMIPGNRRLLIEGIVKDKEKRYIVFHYPFGRRTNDALSRAYAQAISERYKCNTSVSVSDDNFLITVPKAIPLEGLHLLVNSTNLRSLLIRSIRNSELFKQRFRHVAARSFMVLRNYKGKELSVSRQQLRSTTLMEQLEGIEDFPVMRETYNEILNEVMDVEHATVVLQDIERGERSVTYFGYTDTPSSFSHSILLSGIEDIILMEDRSSMLRELHRKVLERVMGEARAFEFDAEQVNRYFEQKRPLIERMDEVPGLLRSVGPLIMLKERGTSIHLFTRQKHEEVIGWASTLLNEGKIAAVWLDDVYFIDASELSLFNALYEEKERKEDEEKLLVLLDKERSAKEIAEMAGLKQEEANELLHRMENKGLVRRVGLRENSLWIWGRNEAEPAELEESLRKLVMRQLEFFGPQTAEELCFRFRRDEAAAVAEKLVAEGSVSKGYFIAEEVEQYMLTKDYLRLKNAGSSAFDFTTVQRYRYAKSFERLESIEAYFRKFGSAGTVLDVSARVEGFSREEWDRMRKEGKILLGRFVRGRVRYVLSDDAPLYVSAYRSELSDEDALMLEKLSKEGPLTQKQIIKTLSLSKEEGRELVERLDRGLWLHRTFQENEEWGTKNVYAVLNVSARVEDARRKIVERIIRALGPISLSEIRNETGFWDTDIEEMAESVGAVRIIVGDASNAMYVMKDEVERLERNIEKDKKAHIISLLDPYIQTSWAEIASKYGDGWFYPVVMDGSIAGMAEMWVMASCVEVRQLNVENGLPAVLDALAEVRRLYAQYGLDILRIREINGISADQLSPSVLEQCRKAGFTRNNGMLVMGDVTPTVVDESKMNALVITLQRISNPFRNAVEAIDSLMYLRSEHEAQLRIKHFISLEHEQRSSGLVKMYVLPDHMAITDARWSSIFRAARERNMNPAERELERVIELHQPVVRKRLFQLSPLSHSMTQSALRSLMRKGIAGLDANRQYVIIRKGNMSREEAIKAIAMQFFSQFGVLTAEQLQLLLRPVCNMHHTRVLLREMEREGKVRKGYLKKGSDTLYWIKDGLIAKLRSASVRKEFIVTQEDRLSLYFSQQARRITGLKAANLIFSGSEIVGAFRGKVNGNEVNVEAFEGDSDAKRILERQTEEMGATMQRVEDEEEWDVVGFYEKSRLGR
jgi:ATP-dependent Lhr-like helicase